MDTDLLRERLHTRVHRNPETGCHEWLGGKNSTGYGRVTVARRSYDTHRLAYLLEKGNIPEGAELDHLCRNRACCNPAHLEPVSHRENCLRGRGPIPRNAFATHCINGHAFDEANTYRRPNGSRSCRACNAAAVKRLKRRKSA